MSLIFTIIDLTFKSGSLYYTTIDDTTARTGSEDTSQNANAIAEEVKDFKGYQINIQETVTNGGKTYKVTTIGIRSFRNCSYASFTIPRSIIYVDDRGFDLCRLSPFPNLPNLKRIGALSFASCSISSIVLPDTLEFIGASAFGYMSTLKKIEIPKDSTYFSLDSYGALYNFQKTRLIWIPAELTNFTIPYSIFQN